MYTDFCESCDEVAEEGSSYLVAGGGGVFILR